MIAIEYLCSLIYIILVKTFKNVFYKQNQYVEKKKKGLSMYIN